MSLEEIKTRNNQIKTKRMIRIVNSTGAFLKMQYNFILFKKNELLIQSFQDKPNFIKMIGLLNLSG